MTERVVAQAIRSAICRKPVLDRVTSRRPGLFEFLGRYLFEGTGLDIPIVGATLREHTVFAFVHLNRSESAVVSCICHLRERRGRDRLTVSASQIDVPVRPAIVIEFDQEPDALICVEVANPPHPTSIAAVGHQQANALDAAYRAVVNVRISGDPRSYEGSRRMRGRRNCRVVTRLC
ncbi:hypothetical protein [Nocardia salmonicida]|uniref:hypothetical protein n=1 Tax=Nocardia salmonicida TaxID=53431 RepID=UPI002E2AB5C6|nr:hypothetical protein [Nocardia salmonicida]